MDRVDRVRALADWIEACQEIVQRREDEARADYVAKRRLYLATIQSCGRVLVALVASLRTRNGRLTPSPDALRAFRAAMDRALISTGIESDQIFRIQGEYNRLGVYVGEVQTAARKRQANHLRAVGAELAGAYERMEKRNARME